MGSRARAIRTLVLGVALALVVAACGAPQARRLPPPKETSSTQPRSTTTNIDYSTVVLPSVAGETTTTLRTTGDTILAGVVGGPEGAVPGAIIRIERLVDDAVQSYEVRADEQGVWKLEGLPGGRFRIRAYLPPRLTMAEPVVRYLLDGDVEELSLNLVVYEGISVDATATPPDPMVGDAVALAVQVAERVVGPDGIGRPVPRENLPVRVNSSGWRSLDDDTRGITDADGVVVFTFECDRVGPVTATAIVGAGRRDFPLDVPDCAPLPTTTTTTTAPTTSTTASN